MTETGYVHRLHAGAPDKPILLLLHGTGGDENQFFDFGRRLLPEATILRRAATFLNMARRGSSAAPGRGLRHGRPFPGDGEDGGLPQGIRG